MVRGLRIRQIFICVDLALAGLFIAAAGMVALEMTKPPLSPEGLLPESDALQGGAVAPLAAVGDRGQYEGVVRGGLFGDAGRWDPKAAPPPPPPAEELPPADDILDTALNLRLIGTVALSPSSPFAAAFIENVDMRDQGKSYLVGDAVMENVVLEEIYPREVIVLNKRGAPPARERLRMDEKDENAAPARVAAAPGPAAMAAGPSERISLNRAELVQDIHSNYADLVMNVVPEMVRDNSGNVIGVTAPNIGKQPLAQKLGVQENDILQTVNNERIDSEEKILEIVQKYQNASSFRIGIIRDGKPRVITYRLD